MSVPINGVHAIRAAGSLMPVLSLDKASINTCTINALKIDAGDKSVNRDVPDVEILPNKDNLPIIPNNKWSLNTALYANFNGDLEAGPLTFYGNEVDGIIIRRSSNRNNFSIWEDIKDIRLVKNSDGTTVNIQTSFDDKTIESGIFYQYAIQPTSATERGSIFKISPKAVIYEDAFLVGENGKQLKLRFNSNISSVKRNIKEARIETIGSKYPFVTRNAIVDYKEFSLSGLITHFMDTEEDFAPRAELFVEDEFKENSLNLETEYSALYESYGLNDYNNTVLEREFREKVSNFLHDGKPKLFKSPKEGVMLVRLMDVNLTPRQDIQGGLVCDFSCTAVEIDKPTVDNLDKYNIQKK